jgi:hypothetical protein
MGHTDPVDLSALIAALGNCSRRAVVAPRSAHRGRTKHYKRILTLRYFGVGLIARETTGLSISAWPCYLSGRPVGALRSSSSVA